MKFSKASFVSFTFAIAILFAGRLFAGPITLASTKDYKEVNNIPVSATTTFFFKADDARYDAVQVAIHELLHAIGFASPYKKFGDSLKPGDEGKLDFSARKLDSDGNPVSLVTATVVDEVFFRGHLDPGGVGTTSPPNMVYPQSNDIMRAEYSTDSMGVSALNVAMLDALYNWKDTGIRITPDNDWPGSRDIVSQAISDVTSAFGVMSDSPEFVWTINYMPEPATLALFGFGLVGLWFCGRSKAHT